jgi:S1-C subfamily serine protease
MSARRLGLVIVLVVSFASLCFGLGSWSNQRAMERELAVNNSRIDSLRGEMTLRMSQMEYLNTTGTSGRMADATADAERRTALVDEIKRQLQSEMGLLPVRMLRQRRDSFVELNVRDSAGTFSYATAGYLGGGYFITVKHAVLPLGDSDANDRRITSISIHYNGHDYPAKVIDSGNANIEVHPGDWAIIKTRSDLDIPAIGVDTRYDYQFADPIFRLGNDYSKGIILSTGYVGERTADGLVTCLTDGHPGVSGGGVLNQDGNLVGIPVGRMQADYRFSFILPLRAEMFRKIPALAHPM